MIVGIRRRAYYHRWIVTTSLLVAAADQGRAKQNY